jgi:hypothetical protein
LLLLNFIVAKTLIHRLVQEHRSRGSSKDVQADAQIKENLQLIATVIYWVTRAAMSQAFPGLSTLHSGDSAILKMLASDKAQGHVLKELTRIGWIDEQKDVLLEIVDRVWEQADLISG